MTALPAEGRRRVVIDALLPTVDRGRFAVKRVVGDVLEVEAHVFPDSHDEVVVMLRHRPPGASGWNEARMRGPDNDVWLGDLALETIGRHEYSVAAWIDHFASWRRDLVIRVREGVVTPVDLRIGAGLVAAAAERASGADRDRLRALAAELDVADSGADLEAAAAIGLDDELAGLMTSHPDRGLESTWEPPLAVVVDPPVARFGAWYELFPRSASPEPDRHGTFRDVIDRLDYVADLGFDVLYLPPIHPIGTAFRKGPNNTLEVGPADPGVPWAIGAAGGGHTATHPELGTIDDFDALVEAATERDIAVALDIAFQASPDHPWVSEHPDWFRARPDGTIQYAENPPKKYQDVYPLDFESPDWPALWQELRAVMAFWMAHGVRIFRVDNPHTKAFDFWEWVIDDLKASDPDVLFLAEAFTRPKIMYRLAKLGFSQSYTYFTWRNEKDELRDYFEEITRAPVSDFFRPNLFTNTPDILHAFLQEGGRPAFELRLVLAATLGATYGIYGPPYELLQGVPRGPGSEEYLDSEKYQQRTWDLATEDSIAPLIRDVNAIRRAHPALQSNERLWFHVIDDDAVLAYTKHTVDQRDIILTVVSLDPTAPRGGRVGLPLADLGLGSGPFEAHDLLGGGVERHDDAGLDVRLDPTEVPARIFQLTPVGEGGRT